MDLSGMKFNMLTVLHPVGKQGRLLTYLCRCDCGNEKVLRGNNVKGSHTKSCGCLMASRIHQMFERHNHARKGKLTPTYKSWHAMKQRCFDANVKSYPHYGGRGITICERWLRFQNFLEDMGERPKGLTIDRINNDGNYEPGNCRWASKEIQNSNRRPRQTRYNCEND